MKNIVACPIFPQGDKQERLGRDRAAGATGRIVYEQIWDASLAMTEGGAYVQRAAIEAADGRAVERRLMGAGAVIAGKTGEKMRRRGKRRSPK